MTTPPPPLTGVSATLVTDLPEASRLVSRASEMLDTVPRDDVGSDATKDLRIRIYKTNMAAQKRIEQQFDGNPAEVQSDLRKADAFLEDANWQLAKKPSPDGRFNGVDIPGAIRDTAEGARVLNELLAAAGGVPSEPTTPPPGGPSLPPPSRPPSGPPSVPPSGPPTPPPGGPTWPGSGDPEPSRPPTPPSGPGGPSGPPPSGGDDYPGEDEFPTDDKILHGGGGSSGDS
jgi:hypothetical protein